jgi:anti-sigma regulatory factor (Ser/Thr protein kinase)
MTLELHATPEEVMRAVEALYVLGREHDIGEQEMFGLVLALEECCSNVVNHAFKRDHRQTFQVVIEHAKGEVRIEVRDRGPAFDPTGATAPSPQTNDEERAPGGWGIELVRRHVDTIRYQRKGDENVLRLIKQFRKRQVRSHPSQQKNN